MSKAPESIKVAALLVANYLRDKWEGFDYGNVPITDPDEHREYGMYLYAEGWLRKMAKPSCNTCGDTGVCEGPFTSTPMGNPLDIFVYCPDCGPEHRRGQRWPG